MSAFDRKLHEHLNPVVAQRRLDDITNTMETAELRTHSLGRILDLSIRKSKRSSCHGKLGPATALPRGSGELPIEITAV